MPARRPRRLPDRATLSADLAAGLTGALVYRENVFPATAILGESVAQARAAAERWIETERAAAPQEVSR